MAGMVKTRTAGIYYRRGARGETRYIDTCFRTVPIRQSLGIVSQAQAEDILRQIQADIVAGKKIVDGGVKNTTIRDILNYRGVHYLQGAKPEYRSWCKHLFNALDDKLGHVRFGDLKKSVIERYKTDRATDGVSPRTIQAELQQLNMALNFAVDDEMIPHNPVARFCRVKQAEPKKTVLDDGRAWGPHWQAIYDGACKGWDKYRPRCYQVNRALLLLLYETGMRPIEAFKMRRDWLYEIAAGYWIIEIPASEEKTGKNRRIPVSDVLTTQLTGIMDISGESLLFPSGATGGIRGKDGIRKTFEHAVQSAELQRYGYTPYALRRTRVTIWDTIDEGACRYAVGHSAGKDSHRRNYSHVGMDRLFSLVGKKWSYRQFSVVSEAK